MYIWDVNTDFIKLGSITLSYHHLTYNLTTSPLKIIEDISGVARILRQGGQHPMKKAPSRLKKSTGKIQISGANV